jgi:triosephosphate isomerase (TIM)
MNLENKKLVVANFKMNLASKTEKDYWLSNFIKAEKKSEATKNALILCPPAIFLDEFVKNINSKTTSFGAQNCFWEDKGSFTGEISPEMIKSLGGEFVILGHSERKRFLKETNEMINSKTKRVLKSGLSPIICVGENAEEKRNDQGLEIILNQLNSILEGINRGLINKIILCYEPVWAISANKPDHLPTINEIMGAKLLIKKFLVEEYGVNIAKRVKIIYGGSADSKNINQVCLEPEMDGVLVGKASLIPNELIKIVTSLN